MKKSKIYILSAALFLTHVVHADDTDSPADISTQLTNNPEVAVGSDIYNQFSSAIGGLAGDLGAVGQQLGQVVGELKDIAAILKQDLGADQKTNLLKYTETLLNYTKNLGLYFGYDLNQYCTIDKQGKQNCTDPGVSSQMLDLTSSFQNQFNLISTTLGANLPSNAQNSNTPPFAIVPPGNTVATAYEGLFKTASNQSFKTFSNASTNTFSVSSLLDQKPYQPDPVSQSLLNILSTPNDSYCYDKNNGELLSDCRLTDKDKSQVISQGQVAINVIGGFPKINYPAISNFASPADNASIISQLTSDSLLGPLMFDNSGQGKSIAIPPNTAGSKGLIALNQIQNAANFIRYATGGVTPIQLPSYDDYSALYIKAGNLTNKVPQAEQTQAQIRLANYLTSLRVYAAQTSVGISNLYYILSKRMPLSVDPGGDGQSNSESKQTSQALSEYMMSTRRLQVPQDNTQQPWFNQINNSSPATVQKEIAILLAEINYQLYLTRMQQERLLMTNTMMLLQATGAKPPNPRIMEETPQSENSMFITPQAMVQ